MTFHTVQEIFSVKRIALNKMEQITRGLTSSQAQFHPTTGGWSIQEIVEHVSIVDTSIFKLVTSLLKKTEEAGKTVEVNMPMEISILEIAERSKTEKYTAAESALPTGKVAISDSIKILEDIQVQLFTLQPRLEAIDLTHLTFAHRIFGTLTLGQWLVFFGFHEQRHLGQIEEIFNSREFIHV